MSTLETIEKLEEVRKWINAAATCKQRYCSENNYFHMDDEKSIDIYYVNALFSTMIEAIKNEK